MEFMKDALGPEKAALLIIMVFLSGVFFGAATGWMIRGLWRN